MFISHIFFYTAIYIPHPLFFLDSWSFMFVCLLVSASAGERCHHCICIETIHPHLKKWVKNTSHGLLFVLTLLIYQFAFSHLFFLIWVVSLIICVWFIYKCVNTKLWIYSYFQFLIVSLDFILKFNSITCNILCQMLIIFKYRTYSVVRSLFSSNLLSRDDEVTYKMCFHPLPVLKSFLDLILSNYA